MTSATTKIEDIVRRQLLFAALNETKRKLCWSINVDRPVHMRAICADNRDFCFDYMHCIRQPRVSVYSENRPICSTYHHYSYFKFSKVTRLWLTVALFEFPSNNKTTINWWKCCGFIMIFSQHRAGKHLLSCFEFCLSASTLGYVGKMLLEYLKNIRFLETSELILQLL